MIFEHIRWVLVEPSHPGNIGSCARAMKNMGFSSLYIVNPKAFPHPQANELAAGAEDILERAVVVDTLEEALAGCQHVFMSSARSRAIALTDMTPRAAAHLVASQPETSHIAMVLGRERTGLTNAELLLGQYQVMIPTNPEYSSLNLAQALQIMSYELRLAGQVSEEKEASSAAQVLATHDAIEQFYTHLAAVLTAIGFLKPATPRRLMQRFRRLFSRAHLEETEVDLLRGVLSRVQYHLKRIEPK